MKLYFHIKSKAFLQGMTFKELTLRSGYKHQSTLTRALQTGSVKKKYLLNITEALELDFEQVLNIWKNASN